MEIMDGAEEPSRTSRPTSGNVCPPPDLRCSRFHKRLDFAKMVLKWAGGHFVFWAESFGPLRVNRHFAFVDAAKIDKGYGQYYQIGVIKYAFLD